MSYDDFQDTEVMGYSPWQYAFEGGTTAFIVEGDGTTVAKLSVTENSTAHLSLAKNARLMASAPELLEALEGLLKGISGDADAAMLVAKARAAVARALGGAV